MKLHESYAQDIDDLLRRAEDNGIYVDVLDGDDGRYLTFDIGSEIAYVKVTNR